MKTNVLWNIGSISADIVKAKCTGKMSHGIKCILDIQVRYSTALNKVTGQWTQGWFILLEEKISNLFILSFERVKTVIIVLIYYGYEISKH